MTFDESLTVALAAPNPFQAVRSLAEGFLLRGESRDTLYKKLEQARQQLHKQGREADADVVLDVMDLVDGWCSPHVKIEQGS